MDQPPNIYLDHTATTPVAPEVTEAMAQATRAGHGNPASQHSFGRRARRVVETARERIAELLGGESGGRMPDRLIFTSGGTEANNLALLGLAGAAEARSKTLGKEPHQLLLSPVEHSSIAAAVEELARRGWQVDQMPVDSDGRVNAETTLPLVGPNLRIATTMLGNNETGVVQPIASIAPLVESSGALFHTDAVQAVGKIDVHFGSLATHSLAFTGHKFGGPLGIGGLLLRGDVELHPQFYGGFQQGGLRPGTESLPLVVGLRTALELWHDERQQRHLRLTSLRNQFEQQICAGLPEAQVVASGVERLPHISNIAFVGFDRQALFVALDQAGVACSTGSACASGSSEPSSVLVAMGCPEAVIRGSLRFSFGASSTPLEAEEAARRILLTCKQLRQQKHR